MKQEFFDRLSAFLDSEECRFTTMITENPDEVMFTYELKDDIFVSFNVLSGENMQELAQNVFVAGLEKQKTTISFVQEFYLPKESESSARLLWENYLACVHELYLRLCKLSESDDYRVAFAYVEKVVDFKTIEAAEKYIEEVRSIGGKVVRDIYENNTGNYYHYSTVVKVPYNNFCTGW